MDTTVIWRAGLFILATVTLGCLLWKFTLCRKVWNAKTRDYWYALVMWCVTSIVVAVSGIHEHVGGNIRLVCVTAATFGTLIGVTRKGRWGGDK
jgi:hypothetical protein